MIRPTDLVAAAALVTALAGSPAFAADLPAVPGSSIITGQHPGAAPEARPEAAVKLSGVLGITGGDCTAGSWFQMITPSGDATGPYVSNNDSPCSDKNKTALTGGTSGGLSLSAFQPDPSPAFDSAGNGLADQIVTPVTFFGTKFTASTQTTDPQTGTAVPKPSASVQGSTLTAELQAFQVSWNGQHFNQGAPKPDGSMPGLTKIATGPYDASSGRYTLDWFSQIVGGPFDKFTGHWHLEGTTSKTSGAAVVSKSTSGSQAVATTTRPGAHVAATRQGNRVVAGGAASSAAAGVMPLAQTGLDLRLLSVLASLLLGAALLLRRRA